MSFVSSFSIDSPYIASLASTGQTISLILVSFLCSVYLLFLLYGFSSSP